MRRTLYAIALVAYMGVIIVLSLGRVPEVDVGFSSIDKLYHFAAYAVMGLLWSANIMARGRWRGGGGGGSTAAVVAASFVVTVAFGVLMEFAQQMTSHRSAELLDAASNGAGGLFGAYVGARAFLARGGRGEGGR